MKWLAFIIGIVVLQVGGAAEACGRGRIGHPRHQRIVYQTQPMTYQAPIYQPLPVASSQTAYAQPVTYAQPMTAQPTTAPAPPSAGVRPLYNYAAANEAQPAYYYTYDNSGKLIVSQWVDYLFRGGRAEGMPRPPLPVIGALRNRD